MQSLCQKFKLLNIFYIQDCGSRFLEDITPAKRKNFPSVNDSEATMEVVDYFIGPTACECDLTNDGKSDMQDWLKFGEDWGRTDCPVP